MIINLAVRYCPREGYKVASGKKIRKNVIGTMYVTVPVRGIRLHRKYRGGHITQIIVTVPVRGIRLHQHNKFVNAVDHGVGYCPREGYKVASKEFNNTLSAYAGYCPREGYKVASRAMDVVDFHPA